MKNESWTFASILLMVLLVIVAGLAVIFTQFTEYKTISPIRVMLPSPSVQYVQSKITNGTTVFSPPLILDAPDEIRTEVSLGYDIMIHTRQNLPGLVNEHMDCVDCHFMGGITQGGPNGGISLVGVSAAYPKTDDQKNLTVDLVDRINLCITGSLNGEPLPPDSETMSALLTYFKWISKGIPIYSEVPWLGVPELINTNSSLPDAGVRLYAQYCASCHGADGSGKDAPPLWGDSSYSSQADMFDAFVLASFIRLNMPRNNPILTPEQALDVALYINSQPRPKGRSYFIGN